MHGPWTDRLSDYIDGHLTAAEAREVETHLAGCSECRTLEMELRAVIAAAHEAPELEPARDLWAGIAAGIAASAAAPAELIDELASRRAARQAGGRAARRFSFSVPQLAAAAVVLMAVSGAAVWMTLGGGTRAPVTAAGTVVQSAGGTTRSSRTVALQPEPEFADDVTALETALAENRGLLDPATVAVIERSLESIDRAIADARAALDADPGNPYLHRQLDNTMRKKVDILRRATRVQRAES